MTQCASGTQASLWKGKCYDLCSFLFLTRVWLCLEKERVCAGRNDAIAAKYDVRIVLLFHSGVGRRDLETKSVNIPLSVYGGSAGVVSGAINYVGL